MGGDLVETCKMLMGLDMQNAGRLFPLNGRSGYDEVRIVQGVTVSEYGVRHLGPRWEITSLIG